MAIPISAEVELDRDRRRARHQEDARHQVHEERLAAALLGRALDEDREGLALRDAIGVEAVLRLIDEEAGRQVTETVETQARSDHHDGEQDRDARDATAAAR